MVFHCINIPQVPWEVLKTKAGGLGFQYLPWDLVNVNAWKTMFDPYNTMLCFLFIISPRKTFAFLHTSAMMKRSLLQKKRIC